MYRYIIYIKHFIITLALFGLMITSPEGVSSNFEMLSSGWAVELGIFTFRVYRALIGLKEEDNMSNSSSSLSDDIIYLKTN